MITKVTRWIHEEFCAIQASHRSIPWRYIIDYISSGCFLSDNIKIKIRINTIPITWTDWKVTPSHNALVTTAMTGSIVPNNVVSLGDKYLRLSINR